MARHSEYAKKRNKALFSLDYAMIAAFYARQGIEMPPDPFMFWTVVCKCICNIRNAPEDVVETAKDWLHTHGFTDKISVPGIGSISC